jgi:DNA-binding CsgD family transcriptional regulator
MGMDGKQSAPHHVVASRQRPAIIRKPPPAPVTDAQPNGVPARLTGSAMFSPQAWEQITRSLELSVRERQIVRGVFDDLKESDLATALGVSIHTIHTHFERLHHKLGLSDRTQLVQRVIQEFLALTASPGSELPPICANQATGRCPLRP